MQRRIEVLGLADTQAEMRIISAVQNPAKVFAATKMLVAHGCQVINMLDRIIWITVNSQHRRHLQVGRDNGSFPRFHGVQALWTISSPSLHHSHTSRRVHRCQSNDPRSSLWKHEKVRRASG